MWFIKCIVFCLKATAGDVQYILLPIVYPDVENDRFMTSQITIKCKMCQIKLNLIKQYNFKEEQWRILCKGGKTYLSAMDSQDGFPTISASINRGKHLRILLKRIAHRLSYILLSFSRGNLLTSIQRSFF